MAEAGALHRLRLMLGPLAPWPRLTMAVAVGVVVGVGCAVLAPQMRLSTCFIAGWDALSVTFLASMTLTMMTYPPERIRVQAAEDDQGRGVILTLVLVAAAASIVAIVAEVSLAKSDHGLARWGHLIPAFGTVVASWFMVQMIFAVHYAHEYYDIDEVDGKGDSEGLLFPGGTQPDYWDFLHFSIVIGVACQTADIEFTAKGLRRLGTLHSLIAFAFNTVIVALTINLLAGLF
jgi:uncharacterized membrane protein